MVLIKSIIDCDEEVFNNPKVIALLKSNRIFIPMPGAGACLNTSQAANIMIYEAVKQMEGA